MGIASIVETSRSPASVDEKGYRTYSRKFRVVMESLSDSPPDAWGVGFPTIPRYSPFPGDAGAVALSLDCEAVSDQLGIYDVTIKYGSRPSHDTGNSAADSSKTDQSQTTPPDRPWMVKFDSVHKTRILAPKDVADVPVVNSAGQPFSPAVEVPTTNSTMTINAFKDLSFDAFGQKQTFEDSVNDADWSPFPEGSPMNGWTFPKWSVKCNDYSCETHKENGDWFWKIDVVLEINWKGWNPVEVLDCGTVMKDDAHPDLPPQPILDKQGNPISTPVPLDGAGHPLGSGATSLHYISFKGYDEADYTTLLTG